MKTPLPFHKLLYGPKETPAPEPADFDSYASNALRDILSEIRKAQATRPLVPVAETLAQFAGSMRALYAKMEAACG